MMSACLENQPNSCNKVCVRSLAPVNFSGAVFTYEELEIIPEIFALCRYYTILKVSKS